MDDLLFLNTPGPTIPLDPAFVEARGSLGQAVADLLAIPDDALEREWRWNEGENELRYGFYRLYEQLESVAAESRRVLAVTDPAPAPAVDPIAAATAARWDLHGLLAGLSDDDLDRDPGGGEWTIRKTLGHVVNVQRAYAWFTAWWLGQRDQPEFASSIPDEVTAPFPDDDADAVGTLPEIRARLDAIFETGAGRLAGLGADELAVRARWSGTAVTVGFRIARWASHLREHTIQVEKTLVMLGEPPSEVERLVRMVVSAYGRLEATAYGRTSEALTRSGSQDRSARQVVSEALESAPGLASELHGIATAAQRPDH
jgi:hypothetical protein